MRQRSLSIVLVSLAWMVSCGFDPAPGSKQVGAGAAEYGYNITGEGCSISKNFPSKADYCRGLVDEAINDHCAKGSRHAVYERECN